MTNLFTLASKLGTRLSISTMSAAVMPAAFAGEAQVKNTHRSAWGYSETDLNIESNSYTEGSREYAAVADKIYIDDKTSDEQPDEFARPILNSQVEEPPSSQPGYEETSFAPFGKNVAFDKFSIHTASSVDVGEERFGSETFVDGTIFTNENFDETSHTTSTSVG